MVAPGAARHRVFCQVRPPAAQQMQQQTTSARSRRLTRCACCGWVAAAAIDTVLKSLVCGSLGLFTHLVMDGFNNTTYIDKKRFAELLESRKPGQGVVTVCNHVSAVDDPGAVATLVPMSWLVQPRKLRWTLCAKDRCFRDPVSGSILSKGKVLPVERGRGIYQPLMDDVIDKLNDGDWVHMFPEGTRTRDGTLGKPRLGVARLIAEPRITPLVVPFYHSGMETILRRGEWIPVNVGQRLCVLVGEPIDYSDLLARRDAGELTGKYVARRMRRWGVLILSASDAVPSPVPSMFAPGSCSSQSLTAPAAPSRSSKRAWRSSTRSTPSWHRPRTRGRWPQRARQSGERSLRRSAPRRRRRKPRRNRKRPTKSPAVHSKSCLCDGAQRSRED